MGIRRLFILLAAGSFIITGCGGDTDNEAQTPDSVFPDSVVNTAVEPEELPPGLELVDELDEGYPTEIPQLAIEIPETPGQDVEQTPPTVLHADSVLVRIVIRPSDWLAKIASREYGKSSVWRQIYTWNREAVGDNPNLIYPYTELDLYKPANEVTKPAVVYITHEVQSGENLWTIAIVRYGDGNAWNILFRDNEDLLNKNLGVLKPGMQLKVRTQLWAEL